MSSVHLACAPAAALLRSLPPSLDWLSPQEGDRLAAMVAPKRRDQFIAARWQVRQLLAQAAGGNPRDWMLTAPPDAPPAVAGQPAWQLSISHSGDWVACAAGDAPLGLDLEAPQRRRDIAGLVALCCTPGEQRLFDGLDAAQREALFYALWTVKESWLKLRREWIAPQRLAQLDARPRAEGEVRTWRTQQGWLALCSGAGDVRWWTPAAGAACRWQVRDSRRPA